MKGTRLPIGLVLVFFASGLFPPAISGARQDFPCSHRILSTDALLVADPDGRVIFKKNEAKKYIPASTLKLLTALTALHHLGDFYRFRTEFYLDPHQNLKMKGYGDPLLISEVWRKIADDLSRKIQSFRDLILDDNYFSAQVTIPGAAHSTNPYDAPVGALCANFNTVSFDRDKSGQIISAEPQTPMTPFAAEKIRSLGLKSGRYTFTHDQREAARYAGTLLSHFLRERDVQMEGRIRVGATGPQDRLIYTYWSIFTLEQVLKKMMGFSNNFIANQLFIALGANVFGPPGTLAKGVRVVSGYAKKELGLAGTEIVEGSGISRKNRISALHMFTILGRFENYRHLLNRKGNIFFKTGSLKGVRTRAGYIEGGSQGPYYFVIFLNRDVSYIDSLMECIRGAVAERR
ncbi:MAG: D-alanyl-D-alanine carboxypeptidase [Desulfobacteraceae bacterium]|nr:D-alanyl-D-alanine carboxypeptidase [Desulfobacteraceae bacterium]